MKWKTFLEGRKNDMFEPGQFNVICDGSGLKLKARELDLQWDGQLIREDLIETRNPQDFLRTNPESSPTWGRGEQPDRFTNGTN